MDGRAIIEKILINIERIIIGKRIEILNLFKGILAGGHVLIEDVPGVGKTKLVKSLAMSLDLEYSRIQFTPDLLPTDILGVSIFNPSTQEFEFKNGPIFSNVILADEINRTPPKTQSALLEVMEEFQVTDNGITYKMMDPFFVIATQNPLEYEGAYRLPEAQMDRFFIKMSLGYPSIEQEIKILSLNSNQDPLDSLSSVANLDEFVFAVKEVESIRVDKSIEEYIIRIVHATRTCGYYAIGISTRGAIALLKISKATAYLKGRNYVIAEDVKDNINLVFEHRLELSSKMKLANTGMKESLQNLMEVVKVPRVTEND